MPPLTASKNDLSPEIARAIEETILLGTQKDLEVLLETLKDDPCVSSDIRYGLESLYFFRRHYGADNQTLVNESRQAAIRYDADWTMNLIQMVHRRHFGVVEQKSA